MEEFAASGGVPDWMLNPDARDPMDIDEDDLLDEDYEEDEEDDG